MDSLAARLIVPSCDWVDRSKAKIRAHDALLRHHSSTTFVVSEPRELDDISFQQQGDPSLNTEEAFISRQRLRRNPAIVAELMKWWESAGASPMCFANYAAMHRKLYHELLECEEDVDEVEAHEAALEDWAEDSGGADQLSCDAFCSAIFETADVYTRSIDAQVYVDWLSSLRKKVTAMPLHLL